MRLRQRRSWSNGRSLSAYAIDDPPEDARCVVAAIVGYTSATGSGRRLKDVRPDSALRAQTSDALPP
jgi:hypothetical protein